VTRSYSAARQRLANRFDLSQPGNQRKLEAAEQLAKLTGEAGMSLIEMAIAFVLRHRGVTSAIIDPRTMEYLEFQLTAADVELPVTRSTGSTKSCHPAPRTTRR
jgi:aryl-alcohol dehydrogenase-like predicted oxidoreductase